jgi:hypothetical protein
MHHSSAIADRETPYARTQPVDQTYDTGAYNTTAYNSTAAQSDKDEPVFVTASDMDVADLPYATAATQNERAPKHESTARAYTNPYANTPSMPTTSPLASPRPYRW